MSGKEGEIGRITWTSMGVAS